VLFLYEQPAGMLPVRTTTFRDGGGAGDEAELRSAWTAGGGGNPWTGQVPVPTRAGAVMGVTVFCEIRIPIPGPVDAAITMEALLELERLLQ